MPTSPLKTEVQYRNEAAQFEAAFRDLSFIRTMPAATDSDAGRITTIIGNAAGGLDYQDSWMVVMCLSDLTLQTWVRKEIRDEATLAKFVDSVKLNPNAIDVIPGVAMLRLRLDQMKTEKAALLASIIARTNEVAGLAQSSDSARKKAEEAQKCAQTWSIVAAIMVIVVAVIAAVIAVVGAAFLGGGGALTAAAVIAAATQLTFTYRGTGADLARTAFESANERYAQCVTSASLMAPASRAKAFAACQARWMADKAAFL